MAGSASPPMAGARGSHISASTGAEQWSVFGWIRTIRGWLWRCWAPGLATLRRLRRLYTWFGRSTAAVLDRKNVGEGKSGDLGGRRIIKKKKMKIVHRRQ